MSAKRLSELKGFLFDLDGTVYLSDHLIPGAAETIEFLRGRGCRTAFISNKAVDTRESYAAKLNRLGIACRAGEVINSSLVCARYLQEHRPGARLYVIGEPPMVEELRRFGFTFSDDPATIDVVVISWDRTFNYGKLFTAYRAVKNGADMVATNPDRLCPMDGFEYPDCACMIAAIEACTEQKVETIVGKPSPIMLREAVGLIGLRADECAMVGDRLDTDMAMAARAGLTGILVLSGVTTASRLAQWEPKPDYVVESIAGIPRLVGP